MVKQSPAATMSLAEAAAKYVATLDTPKALAAQPSISRFVQWLGADRIISNIKSLDVERFVEESAGRGGSLGRNVEHVRKFLAYLKKTGQTDVNLSTAIKLKRPEAEPTGYVDPNQIQMTKEGYESLKRELDQLHAKRPEIAEALHLAMADKDFRENAPLDAARDQQAHVEAQIRRVEQMIKNAVIVDGTGGVAGAVRVGSAVTVTNLVTNQQQQYKIVSPSEVNPREGKISIVSPVGKALVDHLQGDEVSVNVPAGVVKLRVDSVDN